MRVVSLNQTPKKPTDGLPELEAEIQAAIERYVVTHSDSPALVIIGMLRLVERNMMERFL